MVHRMHVHPLHTHRFHTPAGRAYGVTEIVAGVLAAVVAAGLFLDGSALVISAVTRWYVTLPALVGLAIAAVAIGDGTDDL